MHRVVIIGGGFGGINAALALRNAPVHVTLIDKRNFHLFQPLLYQVATGGLSPADISSPIRSVLKKQANTHVTLGEVVTIDAVNHTVVLSDNRKIPYDSLIVATGATHHYFGHAEWEKNAPSLKTVEDATQIRSRILTAFEAAENEEDPNKVEALLTFVLVGGGATGVELAGAIGELAQQTLKRDFKNIKTDSAKIYLIEGQNRILPTYPAESSIKAEAALRKLGVTVLKSSFVKDITASQVTYEQVGKETHITTNNVIWAAGVQASSLGRILADSTKVILDKAGRVKVKNDCNIPNHPNIYVIGDLAHFTDEQYKMLPGVAPVAIQQGKYVANVICDRIKGNAIDPFKYRDRGTLAVIGRAAAVAVVWRFKFSGYLAWLLWLFVHLMYLVEFENRVLVFIQWAWSYVTRNRGARLITSQKKD